MTDQELCRIIAEKVMGLEVLEHNDWRISVPTGKRPISHVDYDPLHDGGQALEIVEKLRLDLVFDPDTELWFVYSKKTRYDAPDLKRAIVLCAARCVGVEVNQ